MRTFGRLIATTAVAVALTTAALGTPAHAGGGRWVERHAMYKATNVSRDRFGRYNVAINRTMSRVALKHSRWMARNDALDHTSDPAAAYLKDGSGDAGLDGVLGEIELRVEVEIAKMAPR